MAPKAIKFPLEMHGEQVRDIDALKKNFDIGKVVEYFLSGKLLTWLEARYYDEEAEAVAGLDKDDPQIAGKLYDIFGVAHAAEEAAVNVGQIAAHNERVARLKQYTEDEQIIESVDSVAFDQEDLTALYDRGAEKIYLCAGQFQIPKSKLGLEYVLVGGATADGLEEYRKLKEAQALFIAYKPDEAFPIFQQLADNGSGRAMYFLGEYYFWGYGSTDPDTEKAAFWREAGRDAGDALAALNCAYTLPNGDPKRKRIFSAVFDDVLALAESGDIFAQHEVADLYRGGYGVRKNEKEYIRWEKESADNGFWKPQFELGEFYYAKTNY